MQTNFSYTTRVLQISLLVLCTSFVYDSKFSIEILKAYVHLQQINV